MRRLLVAAVPEIPGADSDVRLTVEHGCDQRRQVCGVVLAVPVEANGELEPVLERVAEGCLHGAADAEVVREREHSRALLLRHLSRAVVGAVVHDDHLEARIELTDLVDHARHASPPRCMPGRWRSAVAARGGGRRAISAIHQRITFRWRARQWSRRKVIAEIAEKRELVAFRAQEAQHLLEQLEGGTRVSPEQAPL